MSINYKVNKPITADQFIELLRTSTLGERRPIDDLECMEGMIKNSNLLVTAWHNELLIGVARSLTDFHYACYLADLAVHKKYQHRGIGRQLQVTTQERLGPHCKLILVAAPDANTYYARIGYTSNSRCWIMARNQSISKVTDNGPL